LEEVQDPVQHLDQRLVARMVLRIPVEADLDKLVVVDIQLEGDIRDNPVEPRDNHIQVGRRALLALDCIHK